MGAVTPFFDPADHVTAYCEGAVVGGTAVAISGPMVAGLVQVGTAGGATSGLTTAVVGIAEFDAAATEKVTVMTTGVAEVLAGAAITAGQRIAFDSAGKAIPVGAGVIFHGIAWDDIADTATGPVHLQLNRAIDTDT